MFYLSVAVVLMKHNSEFEDKKRRNPRPTVESTACKMIKYYMKRSRFIFHFVLYEPLLNNITMLLCESSYSAYYWSRVSDCCLKHSPSSGFLCRKCCCSEASGFPTNVSNLFDLMRAWLRVFPNDVTVNSQPSITSTGNSVSAESMQVLTSCYTGS